MTDLTPEKQAELRRLAKAATPGPWTHDSSFGHQPATMGEPNPFIYSARGMRRQIARTVKLSDDHDAAFIAAANPATVLSLLDALDAKDAQIAEFEAANASRAEFANATHACAGCGKQSSVFTAGCDHCDYEDK